MYKTITRSRTTYFKDNGIIIGILKRRKNNGTSTNDTNNTDINSLYLGNEQKEMEKGQESYPL